MLPENRRRLLPISLFYTLVLVGIYVITLGKSAIGLAWGVNMAYLDAIKATMNADAKAATRYVQWARAASSSSQDHDAAAYGIAILTARLPTAQNKIELVDWLKRDSKLGQNAVREQISLFALASALPPRDQILLTENLDAATAATLLVSAAEQRPDEVGTFLEILESRGLIMALSPRERIRLAVLYGNAANQTRMKGGYVEEIIALADRALALDPQSEMGLSVKALMLSQQGQLDAGVLLASEATNQHRQSVFSWEVLSATRLASSDYLGAEKAARQAIELLPPDKRSDWAKSMLAVALHKQGKCAEALPYAQEPVVEFPNAPNYLLALGDVLWCLGEREQAVEAYKRVEIEAPGYAPYILDRIMSTK